MSTPEGKPDQTHPKNIFVPILNLHLHTKTIMTDRLIQEILRIEAQCNLIGSEVPPDHAHPKYVLQFAPVSNLYLHAKKTLICSGYIANQSTF